MHMSTASSLMGTFLEQKTENKLPGGAAIFTMDLWASKIIESGEDNHDLGGGLIQCLKEKTTNRLQ